MKNHSCAALTISFAATLLINRATRAQAPTTERVSLNSAGAQANADSSWLSVSADGRFIAFESWASNLVALDTNGTFDVFVRDRTSGTTERVSVDASGVEGNSESARPAISADGRFVAFMSYASNFVAADFNGAIDIFVRDRQSGTIERVSIDTSGAEANGDSGRCSISADGRFVAFESSASNLVALDTNATWDVFVHDRVSATTERVSVDSAGAEGHGMSLFPSISADGRNVAFWSAASNLVALDTNIMADIFVRDRQLGTTEIVSVSSTGNLGNYNAGEPSISADGRFIAFDSSASNLVAGDTNDATDIFVRDRASATTSRVSVSSNGTQAHSYCYYAAISANGRCVVFVSGARKLVAGDSNAMFDVFVHDRVSAVTERMSVDSAGVQGNLDSFTPALSADGRFVAFSSDATNLVAADTNLHRDVFVRDRGPQPPSMYCNSSTSSHGCSASITASANPSLSLAHPCNIWVTNVEGQKSCIVFYGIDNSNFSPAPWASGSTSVLCVKHPTQRTHLQHSGGTLNVCDGAFALDWNAYQASHPFALGNPWTVGATVYAQGWFRDPPAAKATNLSNAIELIYLP